MVDRLFTLECEMDREAAETLVLRQRVTVEARWAQEAQSQLCAHILRLLPSGAIGTYPAAAD